jgi:hypothetical protein
VVAGSEPFLTRLILGFWNRNSALHYVENRNIKSTIDFAITYTNLLYQGKRGKSETHSMYPGPQEREYVGRRDVVTRPTVSNEQYRKITD